MSSTITTTLLLRLSLLLALLSHVCCWTKPCRLQGRRHECLAAPFVPGFSLAGEGFDVTTLQRKGAYVINMRMFLNSDGTCTLYCNPLQGGKLQKVPLSIGEWHSFKRCPFNLHGSSHNSVSSLVQAYTNHETDDWHLGLDSARYSELEVGGSRSKVAQFATTKAKEDRFTYTIHKLSCTQYSYRLRDKPILDSAFRCDVDSLPKAFNSSTKALYRHIVDTYGTHYIRQVYLGGRYRRVSAIRTCLSTLNGLSSSEVESCLRLGLTDGFGMFTYPKSKSTCSKVLTNQHLTMYYSGGLYQNFTEVTGGKGWTGQMCLTQNVSAGYHKWLNTLQHYPDAIKYSLKPIHMLVWDAPRRAGLKAAIEQYLNEKGIRPQSSSPTCDNRVPNLASDCCPQNAWQGTLVVTVVRAYRLNGDVWSETDAYVKIWYGNIHRTTPVILSDNPRWDACYKLGKVDTYIGLNLKVEVWDDDFASDDLLGSCVKNVRQGTHKHTCATTSGGVEFIIKLTCDNHLTGNRCEQYKPTSPTWHLYSSKATR